MNFGTFAKRIEKTFAGFFLVSIFVFPLFAFAQIGQTPPTPQGGSPAVTNPTDTGITYVCNPGAADEGNCTFQDFIAATQRVVNWATTFALGFSIVVIVIAGGRYMISGDNPSERTKANKMLVSVGWGIFFILAAWLIVHLITGALLKPNTLPINL